MILIIAGKNYKLLKSGLDLKQHKHYLGLSWQLESYGLIFYKNHSHYFEKTKWE